MHKEKIKYEFQQQNISFQHAVNLLKELGFTEFAAEQYLYSE